MPFFSVIIPTFNRYGPVKRAIDSVLAQTRDDYELIVVDDGSTDETPAIEREYAGRITYLRQDNRGVSAARNLGIAVSRGDCIAFLDSDDLWLPEKLDAHTAFIIANPSVRIHQTGEVWIRGGRRVNQMKKHLKKEGDIFLLSLDLCLVSPSAVVLHRGLLEETGNFDDRLPVCEDYDLWLRILWRERVGLIPERLVIKYGGHADQLSRRHRCMDRFRVYAIVNLLSRYAAEMDPWKADAAAAKAIEKCDILAAGAGRRGNEVFRRRIETVRAQLLMKDYNSIDSANLLAE